MHDFHPGKAKKIYQLDFITANDLENLKYTRFISLDLGLPVFCTYMVLRQSIKGDYGREIFKICGTRFQHDSFCQWHVHFIYF